MQMDDKREWKKKKKRLKEQEEKNLIYIIQRT